MPNQSYKKGVEASSPFHSLPAQQRTESRNLVNFPSRHINLKVSWQQNPIKSFRADSHFKLLRGCLPEKIELNCAELSLQKTMAPTNLFRGNAKEKVSFGARQGILCNTCGFSALKNSTLLVYNISTQVDSILYRQVGTKLPNTRTSARTEYEYPALEADGNI